jgi:lipid II:glycine glycyltransferase (peptidoglycan interpeptide bridge formation enzyme)
LINSDIGFIRWSKILNDSPFASPFQTPSFYDFFNSLDNFSADALAVEMEQEIISLVVVTVQNEPGIKGHFSKRGIIYGGPLVLLHHPESLCMLLQAVIEHYSKKTIYLEIRNFFDYSSFNLKILSSGFKYNPWFNFHLEISSPEQMLKSMSSSRARQIKKAIKNGVIWQEANSWKDVECFYEILEKLYNNKIKKPLFPKNFFEKVYSKNICKYLLVYFEDKVIGGIMCPFLPNKVIYEFYICGLDDEYKEQFPSVMATWAAMEYASINKIPLFDFMGAGSPEEAYGVRDFKARFGGRQVEHGRYIMILNPILYRLGTWALSLYKKIK